MLVVREIGCQPSSFAFASARRVAGMTRAGVLGAGVLGARRIISRFEMIPTPARNHRRRVRYPPHRADPFALP